MTSKALLRLDVRTMLLFWNKPTVLVLAALICAGGILLESLPILLLSVLLVVIAFKKLPDASVSTAVDVGVRGFYAALIAALAGSATAAWLSAQRNFIYNTIDVVLWLASILLLSAAALWHDHRHRLDVARSETDVDAGPQQQWHEVAFVGFTTLLALGLRVYDLVNLPPMVHGDEGEVGMLALRILSGDEALPIFATTVFGQNPAGFPYLLSPLLALFGRNEVGLRMLSALMGTASVPFLYWIGRRGWGFLAGATAAWLMTVSHFHIHYSRLAVPNIGNSFVVVLMIGLLFRAYHRNVAFIEKVATPAAEGEGAVKNEIDARWLAAPLTDFVLLGVVIGLGQYIYHGARLLPIIAGVAFLILLHKGKVTYQQLLMVGLAAVVAVAPLAMFYGSHWREFVGRSETVFIFREENLKHIMGDDATFADDLLPYLRHQFMSTVGFIMGDGDRSSFYIQDLPIFDPLTLILLWLGIGALLSGIRRYEESVIAAWFALGLLFAGFLTIEQPNGPRLISIAPAIYVIAGIFVQRLWALRSARMGAHNHWSAAAPLGALALILLYLNWRTYFVDLARYTHPILPTVVARAVAAAPESASVYLLGDPILYAGHGTIRFLARAENIFDLRTPMELPAADTNGSGIFILALEQRLDDLHAIQAQRPGGEFTSHADAQGNLLYATYYLP